MLPSWTAVLHAPVANFLATAPTDPTTGWLAYGPLGLMVAGFATGVIVPGNIYRQVVREKAALQKIIDENIYPTMQANVRTTEKAIEALAARRAQ